MEKISYHTHKKSEKEKDKGDARCTSILRKQDTMREKESLQIERGSTENREVLNN